MNVEHRVLRPDGSVVWVAQNGRILFEGEGDERRGVRAIGIVADITARKQSEAALRESEHRYRDLFENAGDVLYTLDLEGRLTNVNRKAEEVTGYSREELLGRSVADLIAPECIGLMQEMLARKTGGEPRTTYELEVLAKDGRRVTLEVTSRLVLEDGRPIGIQGSARDISDRRLAEETRLRLAAIVESSEDAILSKTLDGIVTSWNAGAERMYGYTAAEMVGQPIATLAPPDRPDEIQSILARLRRGERITDFETVRQRKDGALLNVSLAISPMRAADGRLIGASTIARDITGRKRVEAALAASREQLAAILTSVASGITVQDPDGRLLFANDAAARLIGFSSVEALLSASRSDILSAFSISDEDGNPVPPERLPGRLAMLGQAPAEAVLRYDIVATGEHRWSSVRAIPVQDERGELRFTVTAFQDITALKQAEAALRESEARYRVMANAAPAIVWTADPDGAITFASDQWFEFCGITPEQNARGWPELVLHPDDQERCVEQWTRALREGTDYEIEVRNRRHDGEYRWFLTRAVPVRDATGRITNWFGTSTDIHDRMAAEAERARLYAAEQSARADAEDAIRIRDHVLASVSHDLRNPLATIKGTAQMLRRQVLRRNLPDAGRLVEGMDRIDDAVSKMTSMMGELLDVARLEAGQPLELNRDAVDLVGLAREAVAAFSRSNPRHSIVLHTRAESLTGEWDGPRLERVLDNLLSNAIKYSPDGGTVTLACGQEHTDGQSWAVLSVADEGIGIPAVDLPQVFERFHRGANVGRQIAGVGLGLAGVKHIVEQHEGSIAIASEDGRGTTVTLRLPL
jgi:PAS domain S-box-containing protein